MSYQDALAEVGEVLDRLEEPIKKPDLPTVAAYHTLRGQLESFDQAEKDRLAPCVFLMGPKGCGKTSLLRALLPKRHGDLWFDEWKAGPSREPGKAGELVDDTAAPVIFRMRWSDFHSDDRGAAPGSSLSPSMRCHYLGKAEIGNLKRKKEFANIRIAGTQDFPREVDTSETSRFYWRRKELKDSRGKSRWAALSCLYFVADFCPDEVEPERVLYLVDFPGLGPPAADTLDKWLFERNRLAFTDIHRRYGPSHVVMILEYGGGQQLDGADLERLSRHATRSLLLSKVDRVFDHLHKAVDPDERAEEAARVFADMQRNLRARAEDLFRNVPSTTARDDQAKAFFDPGMAPRTPKNLVEKAVRVAEELHRRMREGQPHLQPLADALLQHAQYCADTRDGVDVPILKGVRDWIVSRTSHTAKIERFLAHLREQLEGVRASITSKDPGSYSLPPIVHPFQIIESVAPPIATLERSLREKDGAMAWASFGEHYLRILKEEDSRLWSGEMVVARNVLLSTVEREIPAICKKMEALYPEPVLDPKGWVSANLSRACQRLHAAVLEHLFPPAECGPDLEGHARNCFKTFGSGRAAKVPVTPELEQEVDNALTALTEARRALG